MKKQRKAQRHPSRTRPVTPVEHPGSPADHSGNEAPHPPARPPVSPGDDLGRRLGLVSPPGVRASTTGAQVVPLGYIDGLLWRLVILAPRSVGGDATPQLQHQHPGSGEWEVVAHDDLLAHITWQAYRRGLHRAGEGPSGSGLLLPGSP